MFKFVFCIGTTAHVSCVSHRPLVLNVPQSYYPIVVPSRYVIARVIMNLFHFRLLKKNVNALVLKRKGHCGLINNLYKS